MGFTRTVRETAPRRDDDRATVHARERDAAGAAHQPAAGRDAPVARAQAAADRSPRSRAVSQLMTALDAPRTSATALAPVAQRKGHGGLPEGLQSGVEALSGIPMNDVQVHRNSSEPAKVQALAFAQGTDIHVAPGQEEHLPHEAWHIAQQKQGRVQPTMQAQGVPINDDASLEREADVMGAKAAQATRAGATR